MIQDDHLGDNLVGRVNAISSFFFLFFFFFFFFFFCSSLAIDRKKVLINVPRELLELDDW